MTVEAIGWPAAKFSMTERAAMWIGEHVNERPWPKAAQAAFHRFQRIWVRQVIKNLLHVDGLEKIAALAPPRGVLLVSNHRSFFDQYVISCVLLDAKVPWMKRGFFPVRANFFYDNPLGVVLNLAVGGAAMYPPIFRDHARAPVNKESLRRLIRFLDTPGNVVGMHPEGTRGKGPDPYTLLPAQPGVGEVALRAKPLIVPIWINGLSNDFLGQVRANFRRPGRRGEPIVIVFGDPIDGASLTGTPRPAEYKHVADRLLAEIAMLGARERGIRAALPKP